MTPDHADWVECPQCHGDGPLRGFDGRCVVCGDDKGWWRCRSCWKYILKCRCPERVSVGTWENDPKEGAQ